MKKIRLQFLLTFTITIILSLFGCSDRSTDVSTTVTVGGSIIDSQTQRGVPNAQVFVIDAERGDELAGISTDSVGAFRFDNLPKIKMYVLVEADGFKTTSKDVFDPAKPEVKPTNVSVVISSNASEPCCTGVFTLTVNDNNSNPIEGATVKLKKQGVLVASKQTNASGVAVFDALCAGEFSVNVTKDGFSNKEFGIGINTNCDPVTKTITLETGPCCTGVFTLTVTDGSSNPIQGATVKIWKKGVIITSLTTDANGKVSESNLCGGEYGVDVTKDGFSHKEFGFAINTNCDPVTKTIVLETGPCCTGVFTLTVTDNSSNPIQGATVKIWKKGVLITTLTTDATGKITASNLCSSEYGVDVTKDGFSHKEFGFAINTNCDPVTKTITLETGPCCTGVFTLTVTDGSSNPIQGATVKIWKKGVIITSLTTDANGKVSESNLCGGEYGVDVTKDGFSHKEFGFAINTNCDPVTKTIILETGPCCSGVFTLTVTDGSSNPIQGATVKIWKKGVLITTLTTDATGKIIASNLCAGEYGVDVTKDGFNHKEFGFAINTNCDPVTKTIILETGPCCTGQLTVTVKDANGNLIDGATLKVYKAGVLINTVTTANGQAVVTGLCKGEYGADITKDGFSHKEFSFVIDVNCSPVSKDITLETAPCCTGVFTVTVKNSSGNPISGATVKIKKSGAIIKTETTDANGQAVVNSLCGAEYVAYIIKDGYNMKEIPFAINTSCDPVTKDVVLESSPCCSGILTVNVSDLSNNPINNAMIKIWKNGVLIKTEYTNSSGQAVISSLCKGEYGADVIKDGYAHKEFSFAIDASCNPVTKDIQLGQ